MYRQSALIAAALAMVCGAASAQISIDNGEGNSITIDGGGIHMQDGNKRSTVNLAPGRMDVRSTQGSHTSRVQMRTPVSTTVTSGKTTARAGVHLSLSDKLTQLEVAALGQSHASQPLLTRVSDLEVKVLGKTSTGGTSERVDVLAKTLGVTFATAGVTTHTQTVVKTTAPARQELIFDNNHTEKTLSLQNGLIIVNANHCSLKVNGSCDVVLNGNHNTIEGDRVLAIQANGNFNNVTWKGEAPTIQDNGRDNTLAGR